MLHHVVSQKLTNVSEVLTASIIGKMSRLHARKQVKGEKDGQGRNLAGPMNEVGGEGGDRGDDRQSKGANGRTNQTTAWPDLDLKNGRI
jgi:hypothetical protein